MNAPGVGKSAGIVQIARVVELPNVLARVEALNRTSGNRGERRRPLRRFLHGRIENLALPAVARGLSARTLHYPTL